MARELHGLGFKYALIIDKNSAKEDDRLIRPSRLRTGKAQKIMSSEPPYCKMIVLYRP